MTGEDGFPGIDASLGKAVIIEGTKRAQQADSRLDNFKNWTWDDFERFVRWGVWEPEKQEQFYAIARTAQIMGIPAPGLVNLRKGPPLDVALSIAVSTSFHIADHSGGLTGLGSLLFEPQEGMRSWRIYNPSILTANFQRPGNFGRINGELDSGKTNNFCVMSEQWHSESPDHVVLSNIRLSEPVDWFVYTPRVSTLLRELCLMPDEKIGIFGMDEGGLNYSKPDQITVHVKQLDKLMRLIRKKPIKCSFVLIEQREESVPNLIIDWARSIYTCKKTLRHGVMSIELRGPALAFRDTVKDFPKTKLPFITDDWAAFSFDIDIVKLYDSVAGKEDVREEILAFLDANAQERGDAPKPCQYPNCSNTFVSADSRRKYCDEHRAHYLRLKYTRERIVDTHPEASASNPASVGDFLK